MNAFLSGLRPLILRGLPVYVFLSAYLGLTVLGNVIYVSPLGDEFWRVAGADPLPMKAVSDISFWLLLFLPLMVCPISFWIGKLMAPIVKATAPHIPEIPRSVYVVVTTLLFLYVAIRLGQTHAVSQFLSATNDIEAVNKRFQLLQELGFLPQMVMKSLLVFLAVYAWARSPAERGYFWLIAALTTTIALAICLILLNMKWPLVLFIILIGVSAFAFSRERPFANLIIVTCIGAVAYLLLSVAVLRMSPIDSVRSRPLDVARSVGAATLEHYPRLLAVAINRMAIAAPYYYDMPASISNECAPRLGRLWIERKLECEPTLLVYAKIFPDDHYVEPGTSPAAANLYGYALAGWSGAIICSVAVMIVLGFFLALLPAIHGHPLAAATFVMGAYAAYFFSQLPLEGALVYDHGMWWLLLIAAYLAISGTLRLTCRTRQRFQAR